MKEFVEKLICRLEELIEHYHCFEEDYFKDRIMGYVDSKIIVNQLAEEYNNGWIPVSERLPENPCWTITCDEEENIHIFFYRNGYFCESCGGKPITEQNARYYVPIAWQPLPAPYQKGE